MRLVLHHVIPEFIKRTQYLREAHEITTFATELITFALFPKMECTSNSLFQNEVSLTAEVHVAQNSFILFYFQSNTLLPERRQKDY